VFPEHAEKPSACRRGAALAKAGWLAAGDLTGRVIGLAVKAPKTVGSGRLEQIYADCLCHEVALNGLAFQLQAGLSLIYDGVRLPRAYRTDIAAGEAVILEIRSIEHIPPVHEARLLTDLHLSNCMAGLLLNPNVKLLRYDPHRFVNASSPRPPGTPRPPCFMQAARRQGPRQCDWRPRTTEETLGRKCSLKSLDDHPECQNENCWGWKRGGEISVGRAPRTWISEPWVA